MALFTVWCVLFLNSVYWCCPSGAMQMLEWRLHYCFVLACVLPAFLIAIVIMAATEIHVLRSPLRLEKYQHKVRRRGSAGGHGTEARAPETTLLTLRLVRRWRARDARWRVRTARCRSDPT